jgi:hypothetical protein
VVLAEDYAKVGIEDMVWRSRLSAASYFWRAGQVSQAQTLFDELVRTNPPKSAEVQQTITELKRDYSSQTS